MVKYPKLTVNLLKVCSCRLPLYELALLEGVNQLVIFIILFDPPDVLFQQKGFPRQIVFKRLFGKYSFF